MPEVVYGETSAYEVPRPDPSPILIGRLRTLWEHRRTPLRAAFAGLLFGTVVAFLLPKQFQSTTELMPPDSQSSTGMAMLSALTARGGSGLGALAGDFLGVQGSGDLFIGILRSRTLEDRLVQRFDLKRVYGKTLDEDARRLLEETSWIAQDRKSGILSITVTDHDPKRAAAIAQGYVEELDQRVAEVSTSAARRERMFLEQRLQVVKLELDQASKDFSQFASKNGAIDIKEQGRAMLDAAATLMGQLIAAESELKGLEEIYSPNNVRVRSVQARIAELRSQLERMGGEKGLSSDDQKSAGSSYPSLRELPLLGVTYADLYRRTKIEEAVYETLVQQYELAKVQEAKETPSVKVLDVARVPERKTSPHRLEIMMLFAVLSFMAGTVWVLARSRWKEIDHLHPGKLLAEEVFHNLRATAQNVGRGAWRVVTKARPSSARSDENPGGMNPSDSEKTDQPSEGA
jgi:capsule polysaccharide export protein KpsE/RkpR